MQYAAKRTFSVGERAEASSNGIGRLAGANVWLRVACAVLHSSLCEPGRSGVVCVQSAHHRVMHRCGRCAALAASWRRDLCLGPDRRRSEPAQTAD